MVHEKAVQASEMDLMGKAKTVEDVQKEKAKILVAMEEYSRMDKAIKTFSASVSSITLPQTIVVNDNDI